MFSKLRNLVLPSSVVAAAVATNVVRINKDEDLYHVWKKREYSYEGDEIESIYRSMRLPKIGNLGFSLPSLNIVTVKRDYLNGKHFKRVFLKRDDKLMGSELILNNVCVEFYIDDLSRFSYLNYQNGIVDFDYSESTSLHTLNGIIDEYVMEIQKLSSKCYPELTDSNDFVTPKIQNTISSFIYGLFFAVQKEKSVNEILSERTKIQDEEISQKQTKYIDEFIERIKSEKMVELESKLKELGVRAKIVNCLSNRC